MNNYKFLIYLLFIYQKNLIIFNSKKDYYLIKKIGEKSYFNFIHIKDKMRIELKYLNKFVLNYKIIKKDGINILFMLLKKIKIKLNNLNIKV